jgi:hypothetical protein
MRRRTAIVVDTVDTRGEQRVTDFAVEAVTVVAAGASALAGQALAFVPALRIVGALDATTENVANSASQAVAAHDTCRRIFAHVVRRAEPAGTTVVVIRALLALERGAIATRITLRAVGVLLAERPRFAFLASAPFAFAAV